MHRNHTAGGSVPRRRRDGGSDWDGQRGVLRNADDLGFAVAAVAVLESAGERDPVARDAFYTDKLVAAGAAQIRDRTVIGAIIWGRVDGGARHLDDEQQIAVC